MRNSGTKPRGATSYKDTAFGIIPHSELLKLELEGTKKGLEHLYSLIKKDRNVQITPQFVCKLHEESFAWIFPKWAGKYKYFLKPCSHHKYLLIRFVIVRL